VQTIYTVCNQYSVNGEKVVLVTNEDLLVPARQSAFAVGAFNITNLETLLAITGVLWQSLNGESIE
jgi:hypothetical protein